MLSCKLAAVVLLFVFIHSVESTRFHMYGKFICPNYRDREWCVTQRLMEEDIYEDDVIADWQKYCIQSTREMTIKLQGRVHGDGWFDDNYEPYLVFSSTCDTTKPHNYVIPFKQVSTDIEDAVLEVEIILPNGIIRKSP